MLCLAASVLWNFVQMDTILMKGMDGRHLLPKTGNFKVLGIQNLKKFTRFYFWGTFFFYVDLVKVCHGAIKWENNAWTFLWYIQFFFICPIFNFPYSSDFYFATGVKVEPHTCDTGIPLF